MNVPDADTSARPARGGLRTPPKALVAALAALALLGVAAAGYALFSREFEAARELDRATAMVERADAVMVTIDEVVSAEITPTLAGKAAKAAARVGEARSELEQAESLLGEASAYLRASDKKRARRVRASATARIQMLAYAPELLELNRQAAEAMGSAQRGWALLTGADDASSKAVAAYNKLTKAGVSESQRLNRQAGKDYTASKERFIAAEASFPPAPFELYVAYLDHRIAINVTSQATDKAWLAGDITKANVLIKTFNVEDPKAVAEFNKLPASPDAAIGTAYEMKSAATAKAYYAARDRALEADRSLK